MNDCRSSRPAPWQCYLSELTSVPAILSVVLQAGGASSGDGKCVSSLDINIDAYDQRTEVCFGSIGEVRRFEEYLYGNSPRFSTANELEVGGERGI